jgi:hypothetical protein
MVVNKILKAFPTIGFKRIVYLGAAASIEEFRDSVGPYLARHGAGRFYAFSLANRSENQESNAFDLVPRGSLLVWIDQMLEPGLTATGKRVGRWRNIEHLKLDAANPEDADLCSRLSFIKFPPQGDYPQRHGDFNDGQHLETVMRMVEGRLGCPGCAHYYPCEVTTDRAFCTGTACR